MIKNIKIYYILLILLILFIFFSVYKKKYEFFRNNKEKKILFIHIPKTGGTYVEKTFKKNGYNIGYNSDLNIAKNNCSSWHTPIKYNKNINFKDYITFTIVRNPYNRFLSEYNWGEFGEFYTILNTNCDVNKFAQNLKDKSKLIYDGDCHLLKQCEYLTDYYGNKVENILHQETLDDDLEKFSKKYNLNINLFDKKRVEVKKKNLTLSYLTLSSKEILKNYYYDDFKELKYDFSY